MPHKQVLLGMWFPRGISMDACWAHHEEGMEGTLIPFSLGGSSRAKTSGLESWLQDALSDALLKGCCKEHLALIASSQS